MNKFGIINYSNNCYLNVIIQLFLRNKQSSNIIAHFLEFKDLNKNIINKTNNNQIIKIINQNENNENKNNDNKIIICPKKLLMKLSNKINVGVQNDYQEVFTLILDILPSLEKIYENKIKSKFTCTQCNKSRIIEDTFSTFYIHSNSLEESVKQVISNETFELECD